MSKSGKALKTLNERTALRWFLFALRLCKPQVLEELAIEGAACFSGGADADFQSWYSHWTDCYWLPPTELMKQETRDTLVHGYLDSPERRWHFEVPPQRSEAGEKIAMYTRDLIAGVSVSGSQPTIPVQAEFPPYPLYACAAELRRYRRRFREHVAEILHGLERTRTRVRELLADWTPSEAAWMLLPFSGEYLSPKRPVRMLARDLVYLAMKQAGASYTEIPATFAPALRGHVADDFLDSAPESDKALRPAVRLAASSIGLPNDRIRRAKPGPRKSA